MVRYQLAKLEKKKWNELVEQPEMPECRADNWYTAQEASFSP